MKTHNRILCAMGFVLMATLSACSNDDEPALPLNLSEKINQYLDRNQSDNAPGLSIAIRKDGQKVYQNGKGLAQTNNQRAIDTSTQFRIGSISKPITAMAIMQLVEAGMLDLDDKLLSFYPELPDNFEDITLRHMLSHRSGLLDYIDDNTNLSSLNNVTTSQVLGFFNGSGLENLQFTPGSGGEYSNTGYALLALVVEKVTGTSLPEYLDQNIFQTAGMTDSFVISEHQHLGDKGNNYALSYGTDMTVKGFNSLIYGASGVASNTNDLLKLVEALLNYEIVSQESLELMRQTEGVVNDIDTGYGLGWLTGSGTHWHTGLLTDPNDFWHPGGFDGYQTVLSINPDMDLQIIVLSNGGNATKERMWDLMELVRTHYKSL